MVRSSFPGLVKIQCLGLLILFQNVVRADPQIPQIRPASSIETGAVKNPPVTKVTNAYRADSQQDKIVELGDDLVVSVENLQLLLDEAKRTTPPKKILLFLDGRPLKDITPFPPSDPLNSTLNFPLHRTENSRDVWNNILGRPGWDPRTTHVSIGIEDSFAVASAASVGLRVIPRFWFLFWTALFIALLITFLVLAVKSELLRDPVPAVVGERRPYSLSRMQAAWWFFLVVASYLFIGMITGDFRTSITGTVLVLIGISSSTAIGSAVIDAGKPIPATSVQKSEFWWKDILSDANGVSFHRFQAAAWTAVLGVIFAVQVYSELAMPTFDGSLLALTGISAGTYLGLKIPEQR